MHFRFGGLLYGGASRKGLFSEFYGTLLEIKKAINSKQVGFINSGIFLLILATKKAQSLVGDRGQSCHI